MPQNYRALAQFSAPLPLKSCVAFTRKNPSRLFVAILIAVGGLWAGVVNAATFTWDASGTGNGNGTDGTGTWSGAAANWSSGGADVAWPNNALSGNADVAVIGNNNGAAGTITISSSNNLNGVIFNAPGSGNYILTGGTLAFGGATPTITVNAGATIKTTALYSGGTDPVSINVAAGQTLISNTVVWIGTAGGFSKDGAGTLTMNGGNTSNGRFDVGASTGAAGGGATFAMNSGTMNVTTTYLVLSDAGTTTASTFNQTGGIFNYTHAATFGIFLDSNTAGIGAAATMNISGGTFNELGTVFNNYVGYTGVAGSALNVSGSGTMNLISPLNLGHSVSGAVTVSGSGVLNAGAGIKLGENTAAGTVNLNGGTIKTNAVTHGGGTSTFNFNGGTLQATAGGAFMSGLTSANVLAGGAIINDGGFAITIGQALVSGTANDGGLSKSGAGTLTLTGANTYNGGTAIGGGALEFSATNSLPSAGTVAVSGSGTLVAAIAAGRASLPRLTSGAGSIGGLVAGTGGQGAPVTWASGAVLGIDTTSAGGTYGGNIVDIGGNTLGLAKLGANTLTLTGSNTYSGPTTISAGTLQIGSAGSLGVSGTYAGAITDNGVLNYNSTATDTLNGAIGGTGSLTESAAGTLTLGGSNTYSGPTTVSSGTLNLNGWHSSSSDFTTSGNSTVNISGTETDNGQLLLASGGISTVNVSGVLNLGAIALIGQNTGGGIGTLHILNGGSVNGTSTDFRIANAGNGVAQNGALTLDAGSTLNLPTATGTGASCHKRQPSTFRAPLTLNGGLLSINGTITAGGIASAGVSSIFNFNGGTLQARAGSTTFLQGLTRANVRNGGAVIDTQSNNITILQALLHSNIGGDAATDGGLTKSGSGTLTLSGSSTYNGNTIINAGTLQIGSAGLLGASGTYAGSITDNGVLNYNSTATETLTGAVSGSGSLTESAAGILTLGGSNTYSGPTTVSSGTLNLNGWHSSSSDFTTLGNSTVNISGTEAINGQLLLASGGNSTLNVSGALNLGGLTLIGQNTGGGTGTLHILNGGSVNGTGTDFRVANALDGVTQTGVLTLDAGSALNLTAAGTVLRVTNGSLTSGTVNLNGGLLSINGTITAGGIASAGNSTFNFNGGTLKARVSSTTFLQGLTRANVRNGGAVIDTGTFNDAIAQSLQHSNVGGDAATDGGLTKNGGGTLTLSNTNGYNGSTTVSGGTLIASGSLTGTVSTSIASGAKLEVDGLVNLSATNTVNGTLTGNGSVGAINVSGSGSVLAPGNNSSLSVAGTLTANGNVTLSSTSTFALRLGVVTATDGDQLAINSGTVSLNGASLQLTLGGLLNNPANINNLYVIINGGAGGTGTGGNIFAQGNSIATPEWLYIQHPLRGERRRYECGRRK